MKTYRFSICVVLFMLISAFMVACSDDGVDNREQEYGYAQFKLYKKASYHSSTESSRAVQGTLDYLSQACKIKVTLSYDDTTIAQTLNLSAANSDAAEYGLRSDKIKLLTGEYRVITFSLYDANDEIIYNSSSDDVGAFTVESGGLVVYDVTINVRPRGGVRFTLKKDFSSFKDNPTTRAVTREYTFDEVSYANITVAQVLSSGSTTNPTRFEMLPTEFSTHFDEDDEQSSADGYQTSTLKCDTLLSLPAGDYRITAYELFDEKKVLLESNFSPKRQPFTVEDNKTTDADVKVLMRESDEYIKDYYALYEIWKSLNGEQWYYIGENYPAGANWDFNRDPDLWGDQPGVRLHSNGRVAFIDISDFGFSGDLSPAIGQLNQLIELYLGTHNDLNSLSYDPSLALDQSVDERKSRRLKNHADYLHKIHTATQVSEPIARALAENKISIRAAELYDSMSEAQILDMATGSQLQIRPMDTNHGTICNGLRSLPAEIGNLKELEYLYIANSEIETIPEQIAELESCTDLEIYNCPNLKQFPMAVAQMPSLVALNISNNAQWSASEIYTGLDALATGPSKEMLQILYARQNSLEVMPESFRNLKRLTMLDLAYNKLRQVPALGKDIDFAQLYLDNNCLESLPHDEEGYFCGYASTETFSVKYNRLKKVPNIFSAKSIDKIKSVDFTGNDIDGFEGEEDGTYRGINVETFTLAVNPNLKKYPKALADSNSPVSYIILRACGIESIPKGSFVYKNSPALASLDLSYNKLKDLPYDMNADNLPYLYGLDVSFNSFSEFPYEPLDCSGLTVYAIRSQRNEKGERCLREWPNGLFNHRGMRGFYIGSNDLRRIDDTISTLIYYLDISDNPNIIFDASDICYAWMQGAYMLVYDKSQNILNCDYMLE